MKLCVNACWRIYWWTQPHAALFLSLSLSDTQSHGAKLSHYHPPTPQHTRAPNFDLQHKHAHTHTDAIRAGMQFYVRKHTGTHISSLIKLICVRIGRDVVGIRCMHAAYWNR